MRDRLEIARADWKRANGGLYSEEKWQAAVQSLQFILEFDADFIHMPPEEVRAGMQQILDTGLFDIIGPLTTTILTGLRRGHLRKPRPKIITTH
jgi:hypothetical protein